MSLGLVQSKLLADQACQRYVSVGRCRVDMDQLTMLLRSERLTIGQLLVQHLKPRLGRLATTLTALDDVIDCNSTQEKDIRAVAWNIVDDWNAFQNKLENELE